MARAPFTAADLETARRRFDRLNQSLVTLEHQLDSTGLPVHLWPLKVQRFYYSFAHQVTRAQRYLLRLAQALAAAEPKTPKSTPAEPEPAPRPEGGQATFQHINLGTVDGKTQITHIFPTNKFMLKHYTWPTDKPNFEVVRTFTFSDNAVPDDVPWLRHWDGDLAPIAQSYRLTYSPEEFLRIARHEFENPGTLVDGARLHSGYTLSEEDDRKKTAEIVRKREEERARQLAEWNS